MVFHLLRTAFVYMTVKGMGYPKGKMKISGKLFNFPAFSTFQENFEKIN